VTCFTCGIELFGWSRNDDPWWGNFGD
jgi:hypothetical protein